MEQDGILVVDDSTHTLQLMKRMFVIAGLNGRCAESGEEALRILGNGRFRLLITDWQMPGLDGLELAKRARLIDPELRIVLATAGIPPKREELHSAGISSVLLKPFRMQTLLKLMRPEPAASPERTNN